MTAGRGSRGGAAERLEVGDDRWGPPVSVRGREGGADPAERSEPGRGAGTCG
jgi:hypothetical protein